MKLNFKRTWVLGAAVLAGALAMVTPQAKAAEFGVYVGARGPVAYVPPYPGAGYVWVGGRWSFVGVRGGPVVRYGARRDFRYDRGRYYDRRYDRDRFRR
jgi:hypothetical protein